MSCYVLVHIQAVIICKIDSFLFSFAITFFKVFGFLSEAT